MTGVDDRRGDEAGKDKATYITNNPGSVISMREGLVTNGSEVFGTRITRLQTWPFVNI